MKMTLFGIKMIPIKKVDQAMIRIKITLLEINKINQLIYGFIQTIIQWIKKIRINCNNLLKIKKHYKNQFHQAKLENLRLVHKKQIKTHKVNKLEAQLIKFQIK